MTCLQEEGNNLCRPGKMENKLTCLRKHRGRAGGVDRKLSFIAIGRFLKLVCQGDLSNRMRQEHLCQQAGQPGEESLNKDQCGK